MSEPPRIEAEEEVPVDPSTEPKIAVLDSDDDLYEGEEKLPVIEHDQHHRHNQAVQKLADDEKFVMSGPPVRVNSDSSSSSQESKSSSAVNDAQGETAQTPQDNATADPNANSEATQSGHATPQITVLDLLSDTASSSALPESFGLAISRKGQLIAIYSSSNIWLVNTEPLPRAFMRILEVRRKPVALDVLDDGSILAVLTHRTQVDIYSLRAAGGSDIEKQKTIHLTNESHCLALSPKGEVIAAGHRLGVEVVSLAAESSEADRRTISSESMRSLAFSDDGRTLLATSRSMSSKATTIFSVHSSMDMPFTEDGELPEPLEVDRAWTSSILFPEKTMTVKHAIMLPDTATGQVNELFAFSAADDTWGIYDTATKVFTEKKVFMPDAQLRKAGLMEEALPALSPDSSHAAVVMKHKGETSVCLYRMPDGFENGNWAYPTDEDHSENDYPLEPCSMVHLYKDNELTSMEIVAMRWLTAPSTTAQTKRLLAVGNLVVKDSPDDPMPSMPTGSTGVVIVMDFTRSPTSPTQPSVTSRMTFDLDSMLPGEKLPEPRLEFETEVELVRRRTQAQRRTPSRAGASFNRQSQVIPPMPAVVPSTRGSLSERRGHRLPSVMVEDETLPSDEAIAAFEAPYDNSQPRSQLSLNRAATVAAVAPANRRHLRALPDHQLEYRRADGLREIPHESDADNWVPPPPPYSRHPDPSTPSIQGPGLTVATNLNVPTTRVIPATAGPVLTSPSSFGDISPPTVQHSQTFPLTPPESGTTNRLSTQQSTSRRQPIPPLSASPHHDELFLPIASVAATVPARASVNGMQSSQAVVSPPADSSRRRHVSMMDFAQPQHQEVTARQQPQPPQPQQPQQPRHSQQPQSQQRPQPHRQTSAYNETVSNASAYYASRQNQNQNPAPANTASNVPSDRSHTPSFARTRNSVTSHFNRFRRRSLSVDSLTREQQRQSQYYMQYHEPHPGTRETQRPATRPSAPIGRRTTQDLRDTRRALLMPLTTTLDTGVNRRPVPQQVHYQHQNQQQLQPQQPQQQQFYQQAPNQQNLYHPQPYQPPFQEHHYQHPQLTRSASAPAEDTHNRLGERGGGSGGPFGRSALFKRKGGDSMKCIVM